MSVKTCRYCGGQAVQSTIHAGTYLLEELGIKNPECYRIKCKSCGFSIICTDRDRLVQSWNEER